jgi:uncharacterized protein (UPF0332 family)
MPGFITTKACRWCTKFVAKALTCEATKRGVFEKISRIAWQSPELFDVNHWPDEAGRAAYLAGLHAAQAFLFETTGNVFKRHSTVQGEFGRLTKDNPRVDDELRAFLPQTYKLKAIADYEAGPDSTVSPEAAREAIATARRFVECVTSLIDVA